MLILHIISDLGPGGAEHMLKRLVEAHVGNPSLRHHVISLRGKSTIGPMIEKLGVTVEALGLGNLAAAPFAFWRLRSRIRALKPDIVQTWMYHADLLGGVAARSAGRRNVIWGVRVADIIPEMGVAGPTFWIRRLCAKLSRAVPRRIVYVARSAREVHEKLGYDPSKSMVIHNGYVLTGPPGAGAEGLRRELAIPDGTILIGTAGRFAPQKGYRSFVAAAGRIAARHPEARFAMMGLEVNEQNPELMGWIEATGFRDRFHLLGHCTDLRRCLAALDIFCLQSIGEGFPNVVAEAMCEAVPCIVTDVGDAALLVGETGLVIQPSRLDDLAEAMERLVAAGPEERKRLGRLGFERVRECFSLAAIAGQYEALYGELAGAPAPGGLPDPERSR